MENIEDNLQPVGIIAKALCLEIRRVQQLAQQGVIPKHRKGGYPLIGSVQGYIRSLRQNASNRNKNTGTSDYNTEKTRHIKAQADLAELALEKARGEVVSLRDVEINVGNLFAEVRANIRNLPERVSSVVVGMTDEREMKRILLEEIDLILTTLADTEVVIQGNEDTVFENHEED